MRKFVLITMLFLGGCDRAAEARAWITDCVQRTGFTVPQCEFLWHMHDDSEQEAAANSLSSGLALGLTVGMSGRK